uniref:Uncharacterized protein n=1 Tax=Marseillevirus LCMAC103 TaxID=2506604 RepID=A0A481YUD3_9VIRU|nr:MAG: hypothetical protein LCMAC103_01140 [Marseillevirus LCMAC103]
MLSFVLQVVSFVLCATYAVQRWRREQLRRRMEPLYVCSAVVVRGSATNCLNGLYYRTSPPEPSRRLAPPGGDWATPHFTKRARESSEPDVGLFDESHDCPQWSFYPLPCHICDCGYTSSVPLAQGRVVVNRGEPTVGDGFYHEPSVYAQLVYGTTLVWGQKSGQTVDDIEIVCGGNAAATQIQRIWRGLQGRRIALKRRYAPGLPLFLGPRGVLRTSDVQKRKKYARS